MASFISILKTIAGIEHTVTPLLSVIPGVGTIAVGVDAIVQRIMGSVATVEANNPLDGAGGIKAPAVATDFDAFLQSTQEVLALEKKKLEYDPAALQAAINSQVAAFNAYRDLKASFKIVSL